jgi:hypothetical protein
MSGYIQVRIIIQRDIEVLISIRRTGIFACPEPTAYKLQLRAGIKINIRTSLE